MAQALHATTVPALLIPLALVACGSRAEGTESGDCRDGADNDGDGLFDCDDDGCAGSPDCEEADADTDVDTDADADTGPTDKDDDGWTVGDGDCDDEDPDVHPGAVEDCDGVDDDCDGVVDEGFDTDKDGWTSCGGDCDDSDPDVFTGAPDLCDTNLDNDCDGVADPRESDDDGDGETECDGDCDDTNASVYSSAIEVCDDGVDNDCSGEPEIMVPADHATIQGAIDAAVSGDLICVSAGTYRETIDFVGEDIHVQSEDGAALTTIDGNGTGPVVTMANGEGAGAVLEGFTITNGHAANGGGLYLYTVSPSLFDLVVSGNVATTSGGGLYSVDSSPDIAACEFVGNSAVGNGGGLLFSGGAPQLTDTTIVSNDAYSGGGLVASDTSLLMQSCVVYSNACDDDAAGVALSDGYPVVENSVFYDNYAVDWGGALSVLPNSGSSLATVVNNTFYDNTGSHGGGGVSVNTDYATIANNVFYANSGRYGSDLLVFSGKLPTQVANWTSGDPEFSNPGSADFTLRSTSPCIDYADGTYAPATDFDGNDRYDVPGVDNGGTGSPSYVDGGAFEYWP